MIISLYCYRFFLFSIVRDFQFPSIYIYRQKTLETIVFSREIIIVSCIEVFLLFFVMYYLQVKELSYRYHTRTIIDGIDFSIEK